MKNRIDEALKKCGMKRIELAEKTGIHKATISNWANQVNQPKLAPLRVMAKVLGVDEMWLAGYDEVKTEKDGALLMQIIEAAFVVRGNATKEEWYAFEAELRKGSQSLLVETENANEAFADYVGVKMYRQGKEVLSFRWKIDEPFA